MENNIVKEIKELVEEKATLYEIGGKQFSSISLHPVKTKNMSSSLQLNDLSSIVQIVKNEKKYFQIPLYIVVEDYNSVYVTSSLDDDKEREVPYSVTYGYNGFQFGRSYDYEDFVIALRSMFVQNEDSKELLSLLKTITNSNSVEIEDDGITQKINSRQGIATNDIKSAPIRKLAPFRTFSEIEQPTSEFLFRIRNNNTFSLFEADGGAWKKNVKENIKKYYETAFKDEIKNGEVLIIA